MLMRRKSGKTVRLRIIDGVSLQVSAVTRHREYGPVTQIRKERRGSSRNPHREVLAVE